MDDPFVVAVARWTALARERAQLALQATAQDALARVRELTPVDTGTLRAAWQITTSADALPIQGGRAEDSQRVALSLQLGDLVVIANPVVYAARIEFGFVGTDSLGRHYDQPGRHMLQQTITELPDIAARATARIADGGRP